MRLLKKVFIFFFFSIPILLSAQVDSGYVDIKNGKLFYRVFGEGKPMVFLNGGPGFSSNGYEMYADFFSDKRQVIIFDQRGTGKSKLKRINQNTVTIKKMAKDLEKLREHLNIEIWDVMGHSFGGEYAVYYAAWYPKSINKLILSASPRLDDEKSQLQHFKIPTYDKMIPEEQAVFQLLTKEIGTTKESEEISYRYQLGLKARYYVYKVENYSKAMNWFIYQSDQNREVSFYTLLSLGRNKLHEKLKKFNQPVLIIHGISDFINVSAPIANHKLFLNSTLKIVYDSGHMILMDQPEEYKKTIEAFLDKK